MRTLVLLLAFWFTTTPLGKSYAFTGNDLYERCRSTEIQDFEFCKGYILGVLNGYDVGINEYHHQLHSDNLNNIPVLGRLCYQEKGAIPRQVLDIVRNDLERFPQVRHFPASILIFGAVQNAFPCN